jgi:hypothetical protein
MENKRHETALQRRRRLTAQRMKALRRRRKIENHGEPEVDGRPGLLFHREKAYLFQEIDRRIDEDKHITVNWVRNLVFPFYFPQFLLFPSILI